MPRRPAFVLSDQPAVRVLPEFAAEAIALQAHALSAGVVAAGEQAEAARRSDAATLPMALAFLIAFICSTRREGGLRGFSAWLKPHAGPLAAAMGIASFPSAGAVSRLLTAVSLDQALAMSTALLTQSVAGTALLDHTLTTVVDAQGQRWRVTDLDPTVQALRQRALPEDSGMPPPRRRAAKLASPGYSGRHRGEVIVSSGRTQHAGSGLWLAASLQPGNMALSTAVADSLDQTARVLAGAGAAPLDSGHLPTVMRIDGGGGNVPTLAQIVAARSHFLARSAYYTILQRPDVLAHLAGDGWQPVQDSLAGPRREALDLGEFALTAAGDDRVKVVARLVVTRFLSADPQHKHGAGWLHQGWHYELLATNLRAAQWPPAWVAALYFGRAGLENRFGQENRELDLKTVMSFNPAGQLLATAVGMYVWNRRICLGAQLANLPKHEVPAASAQTPEQTPPPPAEPAPEPPAQSVDLSPATLLGQTWSGALDNKPGWTQASDGVTCPAGKTLRIRAGKTALTNAGKVAVTLRAAKTACVHCDHRAQCTQSKSTTFRKELTLVLGNRISRHHQTTDPVWTPPQAKPNPPIPTTPVVVPSEFRKIWLATVRQVQALVVLATKASTQEPSWLARTPARRQHRRHTWKQRRDRARADARHVIELRNVEPLRSIFAAIGGETAPNFTTS